MLNVVRFCKAWSLAAIFGDGQWCPVCGGTDFTYYEGDAVYCDRCNAKFALRMTGGDEGVVVDCYPEGDGSPVRVLWPPRQPAQQPYFWQVLKTCEAGLDDRDNWCHNLDFTVNGDPEHDCYVEREKFPQGVGTEVFYYEPYRIATHRTWQQWQRSQAGRAAAQLDVYEGQQAYFAYERKHRPTYEATLRAAAHREGLYTRAQCAEVFPQDGYVIHGCVPLEGAVPLEVARRRVAA